MQVLREKEQVNVYCIVYSDLDQILSSYNVNLLRADGKVAAAGLLQDFLANTFLRKCTVRGPAGFIFEIILELVVLKKRRQHLEADVNKSDDQQDAQNWLYQFHSTAFPHQELPGGRALGAKRRCAA